ncbi:MAG: hypothetical protein K2Y23_17100 [Cyanobacteria bacterium]|nr:hypothetical protein [Cyanobacteriota bacterium]
MNLHSKAGALLEEFDVLRRPSDLDLLIFFARHPRALLVSEQIAAFLGYDVKDVSASLDRLLAARLLTRTPTRKHAARMYALAAIPEGGGWLPALMQVASTRDGRLALISALKERWSEPNGHDGSGGDAPAEETKASDGPLPFPPQRLRRVGEK